MQQCDSDQVCGGCLWQCTKFPPRSSGVYCVHPSGRSHNILCGLLQLYARSSRDLFQSDVVFCRTPGVLRRAQMHKLQMELVRERQDREASEEMYALAAVGLDGAFLLWEESFLDGGVEQCM